MILYIVGLVIAIVVWIFVTGNLTVEAVDYKDAETAKQARIAWLTFFLIPLYPAVICVALVFGPIWVFRQLGRISKEKE